MLLYIFDLVISILVSHGPSLLMSMNRSRLRVFVHKDSEECCSWAFLHIAIPCFHVLGVFIPYAMHYFPNMIRCLLHPSDSGKSKKPRVISTGHKKREDRASTVPPTVLSGSVKISIFPYIVLGSIEKHPNRIVPPSDQSRDIASSASGMRKGMLNVSLHFSCCVLSNPSITANIEQWCESMMQWYATGSDAWI